MPGRIRFGRASVSEIQCALAARLDDKFLHTSRVCLSTSGLHDVADDLSGGLHLATADLVRDVGVGCERFVDGCLELGFVTFDDQLRVRRDNLLRITLTVEDVIDDLAGDLVVELAAVDESYDLGNLRRG